MPLIDILIMKMWKKGTLMGFIVFLLLMVVHLKTFFQTDAAILYNAPSLLFLSIFYGLLFLPTTGALIGIIINNKKEKNPQNLILIGLAVVFISTSYGYIDFSLGLSLSTSSDGLDILLLVPIIFIGILIFIFGLIRWIIRKIRS